MTDEAVCLHQISRRFGATQALDHVDLDVRYGEVHALLGENGAGKSTLMHVLAGVTVADSGTIQVDGQARRIRSPRDSRAAGIAMVHQHFTLVPAFTVAENLALDAPASARSGRYSAEQYAAPALESAHHLGWDLPPGARVSSLGVGMQQRVEIAKALATGARILIFDEPTAVLAASEVEELFDVIRRLKADGAAVILIAHKLAEIMAVADRVTVLRRGVRVASTSVAKTSEAQLAEWMVGDAPITAAAEHAPDAIQGGITLKVTDLRVAGDRGNEAIRGLSLSVRRGEIFGIGGVDGNGQSELAEALTGLRKISGGSLLWNGAPFQPGTNPSIGYIPQDRRRDGLAPTMTIEENLVLDAVTRPAYRAGPFLKRKELGRLAGDLIRRFDVRTPSGALPASALSGGNQQKVVIARALNGDPEMIVAVNPTRGLDIAATQFVHEQLSRARQRGACVVLISTDMDEVLALSEEVAVISAGQLSAADRSGASAAEIGLLLGGSSARGESA